MRYDELSTPVHWLECGGFLVSSQLFLDVIFTEACNRSCPFCIAKTVQRFPENIKKWKQSLHRAFELFSIQSIIILGGEATIDSHFWEKLELTAKIARAHGTDRIILTTNGTMLAKPDFLDRLCASEIDSVNLSRMHYDQEINDRLFGGNTPTREEILNIFRCLHAAGKSLRINVNIWRGNLDSPEEMDRFVQAFSGACDAVKFSPLMDTEMFGTIAQVQEFTAQHSIPDAQIRALYDIWSARHRVVSRRANVLGYVDYAQVRSGEQLVILKYAQVEDKYD